MDERYTPILSDEERVALRAQRAARRKAAQQARRRKLLRQLLPVGAVLLVLVVLLVGRATRGTKEEPEPEAPAAATFTVESVPPELLVLPVQELSVPLLPVLSAKQAPRHSVWHPIRLFIRLERI